MFTKKLTDKKIKKIHDAAIQASDSDEAWKVLAPLITAQVSNDVAADALIDAVRNGNLTIEHSLDILSKIYEAHEDNDDVVILIGDAMEAGRDLDYLNDPPPEHPLFAKMIKRLSEMALETNDRKKEALTL